jgi:hypothetical protein
MIVRIQTYAWSDFAITGCLFQWLAAGFAPLTRLYKHGIRRSMRSRQIAVFLLALYTAICISFILHIHLMERPGEHCSICQVLEAPGVPVSSSVHAPLFGLQELCGPVIHVDARSECVSAESERAPPKI